MRRVNLNLLLALDALLREESVSKAAIRLGVGQPAMSHSLGQLRLLFADEILTRVPGGMRMTPRGMQLKSELRDVLARIAALIDNGEDFDPARSTHHFRIAVFDSAAAILVPKLMAWILEKAPGVTLATYSLNDIDIHAALDSDDIDLAFGLFEHGAMHHKTRLIYADRYVAIYNPELIDASSPAFFREPFPIVSCRNHESDRVIGKLRSHGLMPRVVVETPHMLAIPEIVRSIPAIAILHDRIAVGSAHAHDLKTIDIPEVVELGAIRLSLLWHSSHDLSPPHRWLRQAFISVVDAAVRSERPGLP